MTHREKALKWWNKLTFEEKFYKTKKAKSVLIGDTVENHLNKLKEAEIERIFEYNICFSEL